MATFQTLLSDVEAATHTTVPSAALGPSATVTAILDEASGNSAATTITSEVLGASPTITIPPAALGTPPSLQFIGNDALTVPAGGFSTVYAFGDSLSDAGNDSVVTAGVVPVSSIYSDGRFANGNVWVQDLSQDVGLPPVKASLSGGTDYAYGGALTGTTAVHIANPIDLPSQMAQFAAAVPHPSPTALYTVWAGSNDVLDIANSTLTAAQQAASVQQAVMNETNFVTGLVAHGAKDVVVLNVPNLGVTPYETARPATQADATNLSQQYDTQLAASLQKIVASGAASVDLIDTYSLLDGAVANPAAYGLTNVTQPVWTGDFTASNSGVLNATGAAQNSHLFFDDLHPTAAGYSAVASSVLQTLTHPV